MINRSQFVPLSLLLGLLSGCGSSGPELGIVSGTVTLDGQPLDGATVIFQPEVGKASFGRTDELGRYELRYLKDTMGAVVGPHQIEIRLAGDSTPVEPLPARYNDQSELTADVVKGDNPLDFKLLSK
jgi:hypothetical protein